MDIKDTSFRFKLVYKFRTAQDELTEDGSGRQFILLVITSVLKREYLYDNHYFETNT